MAAEGSRNAAAAAVAAVALWGGASCCRNCSTGTQVRMLPRRKQYALQYVLAIYGYIYGYTWLYMAIYGYIWLYVTPTTELPPTS